MAKVKQKRSKFKSGDTVRCQGFDSMNVLISGVGHNTLTNEYFYSLTQGLHTRYAEQSKLTLVKKGAKRPRKGPARGRG